MRLQYILHPELRAIGVVAPVAAELFGLTIRHQDDSLNIMKQAVAREVAALTDQEVHAHPVLTKYRALVESVGRSSKKFPPAAESLIDQVRRTKRFPTINTAVDSYNLVAARAGMALGAHDMAKVGSQIHFRLSPGEEAFRAVGSSMSKVTRAGDFVYADETTVLAWLDSRDADAAKLTNETKDMVLIIQGIPGVERTRNLAVAEEACQLIVRFCGGQYEIASVGDT